MTYAKDLPVSPTKDNTTEPIAGLLGMDLKGGDEEGDDEESNDELCDDDDDEPMEEEDKQESLRGEHFQRQKPKQLRSSEGS